MTKKSSQDPIKRIDKKIDRRRFLELGRKAALVAPPAVGLLIAATDASAHCTGKGNGPHAQPSCATNH